MIAVGISCAAGEEDASKQPKRQQEKAVRLYNYISRLQAMRLHLQRTYVANPN